MDEIVFGARRVWSDCPDGEVQQPYILTVALAIACAMFLAAFLLVRFILGQYAEANYLEWWWHPGVSVVLPAVVSAAAIGLLVIAAKLAR